MRKWIVSLVSLLLLTLSSVVFAAPVDINSAEAPALASALKGVGPKKAEAIVAYRKEHGPFKSVDDLAKVKGISMKTIDANRSNLAVGKK